MNRKDMQETTTVGEFLITRLKQAGVRHLFGVPGDFNLEFLEQVEADAGIEWIGNCNELNGAYAADGYARSNGVGALLTTYGVGELSAINGVAGAYSERVPVIAITGTPPLAHMNSRALLHHTLADGNYDNMMTCMRQFTVAQALLTPQNAAVEIDRCLQACLIDKRPVYLQLPSDVALLDIALPRNGLQIHHQSDVTMLEEFTRRVLARLHEAQRPALLVDADVDRFHLIPQLHQLLKTSKLPLALLSTSKGVVSDDHPQYLGIYSGRVSREHVREAVEYSDCLITLGVRLTDATTGAFSHSINAATEVKVNDWFGRVDGEDFYGISMRDILVRLATSLEDQPLQLQLVNKPSITPGPQPPDEPTEPLSQLAFWRRIASFVREDDVLIAENGTPLSGLTGLPLPSGVRVISQAIWGSIGYTLPATLGSMMAAPDRRHLLFIGDGSFQVTVQELSTMLRYKQRPILFLLNNDGYTIERLILGENSAYNEIQPWRYFDLCAAFDNGGDFKYVRVETGAQLDSALQGLQSPEVCVFVEVILPRMDAPPLLKKLGPVFARQDYGIKWEMKGYPGGRPADK